MLDFEFSPMNLELEFSPHLYDCQYSFIPAECSCDFGGLVVLCRYADRLELGRNL